MSSLHLGAPDGAIAERVLLPGDPLRAKYIAENYLTDAKCYTNIRNMYGYTGSYKGVPLSVQGTGMGIPSFSIYVHELLQEYHAKVLIRTGTCGSLRENIYTRDIILAMGASTDSNVPHCIFGNQISYAAIADYGLLETAVASAREHDVRFHIGNVITQDRYYDDEIDFHKLVSYGILAAEMESAGLYLLAAKYHARALSILTVSNSIVTGEETPMASRENSFDDMIIMALETAVKA